MEIKSGKSGNVGEREIMDMVRGGEWEKVKGLTEEEVNREIGDEGYVRGMVGEENAGRMKKFVPLYSICTPSEAWRTDDVAGARAEHEDQLKILNQLEKNNGQKTRCSKIGFHRK